MDTIGPKTLKTLTEIIHSNAKPHLSRPHGCSVKGPEWAGLTYDQKVAVIEKWAKMPYSGKKKGPKPKLRPNVVIGVFNATVQSNNPLLLRI